MGNCLEAVWERQHCRSFHERAQRVVCGRAPRSHPQGKLDSGTSLKVMVTEYQRIRATVYSER